MTRWLDVKLFLTLFVITSFIVAFSHLGSFAYESVYQTEVQTNQFAPETAISSIPVDGLSNQEAMFKVLDHVEKWKQNSTITLNEHAIDLNVFKFKIKESVESAHPGTNNPLLVSIDRTLFSEILNKIDTDKDIDENELSKKLINISSTLSLDDHNITLLSAVEEKVIQQISSTTIKDFDSATIYYIQQYIEEINPIILDPNSTYSLLSIVDSTNLSKQRIESLNVIASGIYKAILPTNFKILERYISRELPNYSELGYEAKIIPEQMDLSFTNPNETRYTINLKLVNGGLVVSIEGFPLSYNYTVALKNEESYKPRVILQYTTILKPGDAVVKVKGKPGYYVHVYRNKLNQQGIVVDSILISDDFYPPVHRVEQHGIISNEEENQDLSNDYNLFDESIVNEDGDSLIEDKDEGENEDEDDQRPLGDNIFESPDVSK